MRSPRRWGRRASPRRVARLLGLTAVILSMPRRGPSSRDCARALWLLGLTPPVTSDELTTAYRDRVRRTHPDLHTASEARSEAATVLTRALNDARSVILPGGSRAAVTGPIPTRGPDGAQHTRTATGHRMRNPRPPSAATPGSGRATVSRCGPTTVNRPPSRAPRSRPEQAWSGCCWPTSPPPGQSTCGSRRSAVPSAECAGGRWTAAYRRGRVPDCLADLDRLERRPTDADRIRSAIEARAEAGRVAAAALGEEWLVERAVNRRRWARRLKQAEQHDLRAALLGAFSSAFERWAA